MKCNASNFIIRLKKQKEDALEYIIEQYSSIVHAVSYKILNNTSSEAVDEIINDVFLTVWQNAHQFVGEPEDFFPSFIHVQIRKLPTREIKRSISNINTHIDNLFISSNPFAFNATKVENPINIK